MQTEVVFLYLGWDACWHAYYIFVCIIGNITDFKLVRHNVKGRDKYIIILYWMPI